MALKTKKVILFIAEGPTDEETLSPILKKIFHNSEVRFHIVHGDMTSNWSVSPANAVKTVNQHIENERKLYGFNKKDVTKVIHLVDTDGVFIPSDQIIYGEKKEILYYDDRIETISPKKIMERNEHKSQILQRLYMTNRIGSIPYHIYYFSRNIEHVFHNANKNLTTEEKVNYADEFTDHYKSRENEFVTFLATGEFAVPGNYLETWEYITKDENSLQRHSNFHLLFQEETQL